MPPRLGRRRCPSRPRDALDAGADEGLFRISGTAWRCMLAPISARLASSCSRNGISEAATDTICAARRPCTGCARPRSDRLAAVVARADELVDQERPSFGVALACAITYLAFLDRRQVVDLVGDLAAPRRGGTGLEEAVLVELRVSAAS